MRAIVLVPALALTLMACEGGGDPVDQALREEAANNHAEAEFARQQQAAEHAARAAQRQSEIDRLNREIAVAEVALGAATEPDVRAAAQASLDESRRALTALEDQPATAQDMSPPILDGEGDREAVKGPRRDASRRNEVAAG